MSFGIIIVIAIVFVFLSSAIRIVNEYDRGVVLRFGKVLSAPKGPGLIILQNNGQMLCPWPHRQSKQCQEKIDGGCCRVLCCVLLSSQPGDLTTPVQCLN